MIDSNIFGKPGYRPLNESKEKKDITLLNPYDVFSAPKTGKFRGIIEDILSDINYKDDSQISTKLITEKIKQRTGQNISLKFQWEKTYRLNEEKETQELESEKLDKIIIYFENDQQQLERLEYRPL